MPHSIFQPQALLFHGGARVCRERFPAMIEEATRCAATLRAHNQSRLASAYERDAAEMSNILATL